MKGCTSMNTAVEYMNKRGFGERMRVPDEFAAV